MVARVTVELSGATRPEALAIRVKSVKRLSIRACGERRDSAQHAVAASIVPGLTGDILGGLGGLVKKVCVACGGRWLA